MPFYHKVSRRTSNLSYREKWNSITFFFFFLHGHPQLRLFPDVKSWFFFSLCPTINRSIRSEQKKKKKKNNPNIPKKKACDWIGRSPHWLLFFYRQFWVFIFHLFPFINFIFLSIFITFFITFFFQNDFLFE